MFPGMSALLRATLLLVLPAALRAQDARPVLEAKPLGQHRIVVDGRLDDPAWQGDRIAHPFVQREPLAGQPASHPTEVLVRYDASAVYVGLRLHDSAPDSIARQVNRRDNNDGYSDWVYVGIDSYFDRRTAFVFAVNPANVQYDALLFNDTDDDQTWDAVWVSGTRVDSAGWTAELRIPLSQLRYLVPPAGTPATWGFQVSRQITRHGEESFWSPAPPTQPGIVSRFGNLTGLRDLGAPSRLQLLPYLRTQATRAPGQSANPFFEATAGEVAIGGDLRYVLPAGLTLTGTVNPDFGQVEADPAVVNLSAFEVFFPERRPFFLEGTDIFRFGRTTTLDSDIAPNFFYSRRIGRAPQRRLGSDVAFSDVPRFSTILGATKLSGKTGPWTSGLLAAVTDAEEARVLRTTGTRDQLVVEPRTFSAVERVRRDFRGGMTVLGGFASQVRRDLSDSVLTASLAREALTAGADFEVAWARRTWAVSGVLAGARVAGDPRVMTALQRSNVRLFQRPDNDYLDVDTTQATLEGWYGAFSLAKPGGLWRASITYEGTSPGLEANDLGFQTRADMHALSSTVRHVQPVQGRLTRSWSAGAAITHNWNFGGDLLAQRYAVFGEMQLRNFWTLEVNANANPRRVIDDRLTRGGPLTIRPRDRSASISFESDDRRAVVGELRVDARTNEVGESEFTYGVGLELRPAPSFRLRLEPQYNRQYDVDQYLTTTIDPNARRTFGRRYVFGDIEQRTIEMETRAEWILSPRFSLQIVAQPFTSTGRFDRFKDFRAPRTFTFDTYGVDKGRIERANGRVLVEPGDGQSFSFGEPDFTVRALRGNAVMRWECRPGSTLFLVWQQSRQDEVAQADPDVAGAFQDIARAPATNVFLVKIAHFLGR